MTLDDYILSHISPEGDYLYRLYRATNVHLLYGRMASGHLQGRLLKMIVQMTGARNILEVGTFSGYSAICLAEGVRENTKYETLNTKPETLNTNSETLNTEHETRNTKSGSQCEVSGCTLPSHSCEGNPGRVVTFEINDELEPFTRPWLENSPVGDLIDFRIGNAVEEAPKLGMEFDLVFLDGDKRKYLEAYDMAMKVTRPGGYILADNTLWDGHVVEEPAPTDRQTKGIMAFNDFIRNDKRVEVVILPLRDGLTLIKKRL